MAAKADDDLRGQIEQLEQELAEERHNVTQAAEIGKVLLENNHKLNQQIEQMEHDHIARVEELEQEKYSLQLKLNSKLNVEAECSEELETLKATLRQQREQFENFKEIEHNAKMSENRKQISAMQAEVEKKQLHSTQLQDKCDQLQEQLQQIQDQLKVKVDAMNETCSEEVVSLHNEVHALQAEKLSLNNAVNDAEAKCQEMALVVEQRETRIREQDQELEEKQCQATSYYNALEHAREEAQELKVQMDILTMECQSQKSKGNSLFSEVEDRRVEAEKELISVKVQCQSLQSQLQHSREQLHRLKMQLSGMFQMSGARADASHLHNLQQELEVSRGEVRQLTEKLHNVERDRKVNRNHNEEPSANGVEETHSTCVRSIVESKDVEIEKLKKELSMERLFRLSESDRVIQGQRKLYEAECSVDKLRGQNMKLQVQLEAMCMKYEPDAWKSKQKKRVIEEKIPTEDDENTNNDPTEGEPITKQGKLSDGEESEVKVTEPLLGNRPEVNTKPKIVNKRQGAAAPQRLPSKSECKQQ